MHEIIARMYKTGKLSADGIRNAVRNSWITEEQAEEILNGKRETE